MQAIVLADVTKRYGSTHALNGLSLEIAQGEMFGLIGPDGAGKTTAIRLICGLLHPDKGTLRVMGLDPVKDHKAITHKVGYLSQRFSLYGDLTIDENIAFFAEIHGVTDYRERRNDLLAMTQLTRFRDRLADKLSGGMKQKLALACTLVHQPDVVLLDEPTTGVDPVSRREFWKLLSHFLDSGITILMTTPYLDEAERCHRVALVHDGRTLALDTPARLRTSLPGIWIESFSTDARGVRDRLRATGHAHVEVFGERLHLWVPEAADEAAARQTLAALAAQAGLPPIEGRVITPSLEDVFIARLAELDPRRRLELLYETDRVHPGRITCVGRHGRRAAPQPPPQPGALRLTLEEATTRAVEQSHRLAEARARQQATTANIEVRRKADDPTLTASAGYTRTNHVDEFGVPQPNGQLRVIYPDIPDNFRTRLELVWPIYTGGRSNALALAAQAEATATGKDLDAARLDLRLEVARAYWALVTARDTVRVLEQSLATADQSLTDVRTRVDAGFLPPNDVSRSEAQRARSELLLVEARGRVEAVTIDLARLIGASDVPAIEPADALEGPAATSTDASALVTEALGQRPELAAISERAGGITARLDAIAATRKPAVSFATGYDFANPNPRIFPRQDKWQDSYDLSLNVSWQFWDSGRAKADRAEALFNQSALTERQREVETQIRADVRKALVDMATSRAALAPARLAVTAAQETRRVVNDRFEAGVATTLDVLDAQLSEMQAELDRARVLADIRLAEARLTRVVGR